MDSDRFPFLHKKQEQAAPPGFRGNDHEQGGGPRPGGSLPPIPYPGGNCAEGYRRRGFFLQRSRRGAPRGAFQPPARVAL
jgi:hypothetical protein